MNEVWKDIPRYENIYEASNYGRIRTHKNKITYTEKHGIRHWKPRILKHRGVNYITGHRVSLWKEGLHKDYLVARLIATTFLEDLIETNMTVNHIDGNRFNNNIDNLEWCSRGENISKAFESGLYKQDKVIIKNIRTKKQHIFISKAKASRFLNRYDGYVSAKCNDKIKIISSKNGEEYNVVEIIKANQKIGTSIERLKHDNISF